MKNTKLLVIAAGGLLLLAGCNGNTPTFVETTDVDLINSIIENINAAESPDYAIVKGTVGATSSILTQDIEIEMTFDLANERWHATGEGTMGMNVSGMDDMTFDLSQESWLWVEDGTTYYAVSAESMGLTSKVYNTDIGLVPSDYFPTVNAKPRAILEGADIATAIEGGATFYVTDDNDDDTLRIEAVDDEHSVSATWVDGRIQSLSLVITGAVDEALEYEYPSSVSIQLPDLDDGTWTLDPALSFEGIA